MGLLTIHRADTDAEICREVRQTPPSATWGGTFTGIRTFNCQDKVMPNDLVIGGKTLNCKDKIMPYNVKANYRGVWKKYNSYYEYSAQEESVSVGHEIYVTALHYWYVPVITSFEFNTTDGLFHASGVSWYHIDESDPESYEYVNYPHYTAPPQETMQVTNFNSIARATTGGRIYCHGSWVESADQIAKKYTSVGAWHKGSYIADVENANVNAFPDNGRHTDGYWYVKQY